MINLLTAIFNEPLLVIIKKLEVTQIEKMKTWFNKIAVLQEYIHNRILHIH